MWTLISADQCDEERPICSRCSKLKAECTWQDSWSSMVRHQEKWAEKKVVQRVEKVQLLRDAGGEPSDQSSRSRSRRGGGPNQGAEPALQPFRDMVAKATWNSQPQIRPEIYAINRFYIDYSFAAATCPFLYRVNTLYNSDKAPNALHSVVPAVALASAARRHNRHDLMQEATQHYGKTLRRLASGLADSKIAKTDATLLTVFMLGLYEVRSCLVRPHQPPTVPKSIAKFAYRFSSMLHRRLTR